MDEPPSARYLECHYATGTLGYVTIDKDNDARRIPNDTARVGAPRGAYLRGAGPCRKFS